MRFNQKARISGALFYAKTGGGYHFVQWMEGERETIESLYARIRRDTRHTDCEVLWEGETETIAGASVRVFPRWTMAQVRPHELCVTAAGFLDAYLHRTQESTDSSKHTQEEDFAHLSSALHLGDAQLQRGTSPREGRQSPQAS